MERGRFISFEGGEGVGKSTQIALLVEHLRKSGRSVVATREPGGTSGAEVIRALLLTGDQDRWNDATEALLFAAARADHVAKLITPALQRGDWVICDRFIDSTRAYQGGAGGLSDDDVMSLHRVGSGGMLPDRTILLDLSPETGVKRASARDGATDRMGSKSADYYAQVAARFRKLAAEEPDRFCLVDAEGAVEEVHARVLASIGDLV